ncbi:MAG: hypothetical protein WA208_09680 [Thermoanaerobaculia bacterium]
MIEPSPIQASKLAVIAATGLSRDALHVYVGLAVFLGASILSRRSIRSLVPWAIVLLVAILGEAVDLRDSLARAGRWRWEWGVRDIVNTVFWPTVLVVLARFTRAFGPHGDTNRS